MTTEAFVNHLKNNLLGDAAYDELKLDAWIYGPGLPGNCPAPASNKFTLVEQQIAEWQNGTDLGDLNTKDWSSHEWLHFVRNLPQGLTFIQMKDLDESFGFTKSGNSEILAAWFQHTIANDYTIADNVMKEFLISVGRRKFLTPTYKALLDAGKKDMAVEIYTLARPNYHSVATQTMDELLSFK